MRLITVDRLLDLRLEFVGASEHPKSLQAVDDK
jgi:hypothetical protein